MMAKVKLPRQTANVVKRRNCPPPVGRKQSWLMSSDSIKHKTPSNYISFCYYFGTVTTTSVFRFLI